jgi:hypothetical protein
MVSANRQKIIVRQAPAMATGMFSIVALLVGDVDFSRTVVLLARSSTVFLHRISAVLQGNNGSGRRGCKRGINVTANARFVLRLHACAGSNQFPEDTRNAYASSTIKRSIDRCREEGSPGHRAHVLACPSLH